MKHIILRETEKKKETKTENKKPGVKSKMDDSKTYKKIHPEASAETRKQIKVLSAMLDLEMWEVVEKAIEDLAKKNKIN